MPQYGGPPGPPPRKRSAAPIIFTIVAVIALAAIAVAAFFVVSRNDTATADEVFLAAADEPGPDPYMPSVASPPKDARGTGTTVANASTTAPTVPPPSGSGQRTYVGSQPGLYGGTMDVGSCDPEKMLTFLDQNPDKKAAWASVQGIAVSEVRSYVNELTPVVLRTDTYVTNHGYANGRATSIQAVLQAGTAVMVDHYGVPRVKCYCGNPLTPPITYKSPVYRGSTWSWFKPTTVVIIKQSVTIIDEFILLTPNGDPFKRPAGSTGGRDQPGPDQLPSPEPDSSTTAPPATSPPPSQPLPTFEVPTTPPPIGPSPSPTTPPVTPPTLPPPTPTTPTTSQGPEIDVSHARAFFINALGNCALGNATRQIVTPQGGNTFTAEADFFEGGKPKHGIWRITYAGTQGSLTPVNADAQVCSV